MEELNNTNSKEFEEIFWEVIHNKCLFKLIFHFIETVEWIKYTHIDQIHVDNRIKFKNIHSLEWMIVNKQYELLKCKLQHCEKLSKMSNKYTGDFIDITFGGINRLLKLGKNDTNSEKEDENNEYIFMTKQEQLSIERITLSEILILILDTKKLEIANMNLPLMAIKNNNSTALKILINEPYSYQIFPSDLEWTIKNSSPLIVSEIINSQISTLNIIISPSTKNKSIKLACKNDNYRDEMLQFILNNSQLYNSPESSSLSTSTLPTKISTKKLKSESGTPINIVDTTCNTVKTLSVQLLLKIKSSEIQNRLLDLHFIKQRDCDKSITRISNSINKLLEIYDGNTVDRVKEIHKLLSMESNLYYRSFLSRYDEPINELDLMIVIKHCLLTFSSNSLSFLLSNNKNIGYLNTNKLKIKDMLFYSNKSPTMEFIKLYISNIQIFNNRNCSEFIDNYILNYGSTEYESILNEISNSTFNRYPSKWNSILQSKYDNCIKKETIDYLVEFKSNQIIQKVIGQLNIKYFESCSVIEYAIKSFTDNSIVESKINYGDIFKFAINNCDIDTLLTCYHGGELIDKTIVKYPLSEIFGKQSIENLNKLFNFFKSINYNCFTEQSFIKLIDLVCYSSSDGNNVKSIEEINQLSISSIPFNKYKEESIRELVSSILHFKSNKIQFILNNFNPISIDISKSKIKEIWNENINNDVLYTFKRQISFLYDISYIDPIVQCIEIILNHFGIEENTSPKSKINIEMYSIIINHLFKCLISSKGVELLSILNVLKLINKATKNENGIQQAITIEHTLYHSFFYICIKSIKFQKYLMELPSITSILNVNENEDGYEIGMDVGTFKGYNISKYLDSSIFTFEYLFGNNGYGGASFDDVLFKLITHLSILPSKNDKKMIIYEDEENDFYSKSLNSNLIYLLDIKRPDLFFQLLDQIQQQLNDKKFKIGKFPTIIKIENLSIKNKTIIESINDGDNGELYQHIITNGRIFKFSIDLFNLACIVFENRKLEFRKFISFCGYHSIVDCIKDTNNTFINELYLNHFIQFQTILNIHRNESTNQLFDNIVISTKNNQNSYETIVYGSSDNHGAGCEENGITINHLIKFQNIFFNPLNNGMIKYDALHNLLSNYSLKFNILLRELFIKTSNNNLQNLSNYFKISKPTIDSAIKYDQIGYLKYYYGSGIINNDSNEDDDQNQLLQFLRQQLLFHKDYKFVNWLNK